MSISAAATRISVVLCIFVFSSPTFSVIPGPKAEKAQQIIHGIEDPEALPANKGSGTLHSFGVRIAGTYLVTRQPEDGPSRILNIFADGNLTSIQSTQIGGAAIASDSFSDQQGTWKRVGQDAIDATVLDLTYKAITGEFVGIAIARYHLQFDKSLQTVTGEVKGKIFSPGIDPLNPGEIKPIAEFSDSFQAHRVRVGD
jgi:hypothetical protein